jgi:SAM-dependent methyltransferase
VAAREVGHVQADVGDPVSEFYTRHPYPPPVTNLDRARDEWQDANRHRAEYHLLWPNRPYRADLDILVAGCGTWQAAKYAICRPAARIVGIDVSATSIACTEGLKRKYGLANLEIRHLPLEEAGSLGRRFDLIVCTGVLHHLVDPDVGLRALGSVLTHDGAMHLMVYAPYGRIGAHMLQQYCRTLGIGTSDGEIHDLVLTLETLPQQHPLVTLFRGSRDARNADALADALLNPRDRSYSVAELFDALDRNGLSFGRWYRQAPYLPSCGAIASTPHAARLSALSRREQYVAMELWRGAMTSHSAIVHRRDAGDMTIRFDDERWRRYVPVRLPWTQLVRERLPPGAAGVLLNRSHQDRDLIIPLDAGDARLFERIDGCRTIAQIAGSVNGTECGGARTCFETLWSYDQVVFDASHAC